MKKKRDFDFENAVKSKAVKPKMPTLTPKISDLLDLTQLKRTEETQTKELQSRRYNLSASV